MVRDVLPISDAVKTVEQAFIDVASGDITMGNRGTLDMDDGIDSCIFLPALHKTHRLYTMKYAASFPSCAAKGQPTVQSIIWLFSADTGEVCAMIEANDLTAIKTGAASAVATNVLSHKEAAILTIIGAGNQARTQLEGILQVRSIKEIRIVDLSEKRAMALKEWAERHLALSIPVSTTTSPGDAAKGSDIIVTCTTAKTPVINGEDIKPGAHINAIGSFTPDMQEIDETIVLKADAVVADSLTEVWNCSGDLIIPLKKGLISSNLPITELGNILKDQLKIRTSADQITLYDSVGFAPLDLAMAIEVYNRVN